MRRQSHAAKQVFAICFCRHPVKNKSNKFTSKELYQTKEMFKGVILNAKEEEGSL
jgi:hypothetical protein